VGDLTTQTIAQFKFDIAVIGCSALDGEGDLLDFDIQEVGVSRTILRQARRAILVADHSKFQRSAPARIASLAFGPGGHIGMMPERLAFVDVRDVDLEHWPVEGVERIEHRHRGMGERAGVDDYARRGLAGGVDPVDDLPFPVGLVHHEAQPMPLGHHGATGLHIGEGVAAVDLGLAFAEQVQVGAVQDGDQSAHRGASLGYGNIRQMRRVWQGGLPRFLDAILMTNDFVPRLADYSVLIGKAKSGQLWKTG
jgi:hypothetical protein